MKKKIKSAVISIVVIAVLLLSIQLAVGKAGYIIIDNGSAKSECQALN